MILTINEHLQALQNQNRIDNQAAQQVLARAMKHSMPDINDLEPIQVSIMLDAMSAAHIKYPEIHHIISKDESITTEALKQQVTTLVYPTIEAAFDPKYFPEESKAAWLMILVMYIDAYYERLSGRRRVNSTMASDGEQQ